MHCEGCQGFWSVGVRKEFPLQGIEVVFQILPELDNILLFRLALPGVHECEKEIVIAAQFLEKVPVCLHGISRSPEEPKSHSTTVVKPVANVDVTPVVDVEVVVAALDRAKP